MTTTITGIDIRKSLLKIGVTPSEEIERLLLKICIDNHISDWELDGEVETLMKGKQL
jgi:hypothetical protein